MNAYKLLFKNDGWQQLVISLCWHKKPPKWVLSKSTHCIDQYSENGESPRNSVKIGRRVVDLQKLGRSQLRFPGISIHLLFILLFQSLKEDSNCPPNMRENWLGCRGTTQEPTGIKPAMTWKLLAHQRHCRQRSKFYIAMTEQQYVSEERDWAKTGQFGHNDNRCVWWSKGEAFKPKNIVPAVSPIDNLWTIIKSWVGARKPTHLNELY